MRVQVGSWDTETVHVKGGERLCTSSLDEQKGQWATLIKAPWGPRKERGQRQPSRCTISNQSQHSGGLYGTLSNFFLKPRLMYEVWGSKKVNGHPQLGKLGSVGLLYHFIILRSTAPQTLMCRQIPGDLQKCRFSFGGSGVGPKILHCVQGPRR